MQYEIDCQECRFFGVRKVCNTCDSGELFAEIEVAELDFNDDGDRRTDQDYELGEESK
jgi:hypothetical protein